MNKIVILLFIVTWGSFSLFYFREELFGRKGKESEKKDRDPPDLSLCMGNGKAIVPSQKGNGSLLPEQPTETKTETAEVPDIPDSFFFELDAEDREYDRIEGLLMPEAGEEEDMAAALEDERKTDEAEKALSDPDTPDEILSKKIHATSDLAIFEQLRAAAQDRARQTMSAPPVSENTPINTFLEP